VPHHDDDREKEDEANEKFDQDIDNIKDSFTVVALSRIAPGQDTSTP
jgi:hypothetical protein